MYYYLPWCGRRTPIVQPLLQQWVGLLNSGQQQSHTHHLEFKHIYQDFKNDVGNIALLFYYYREEDFISALGRYKRYNTSVSDLGL